MDTNDEVRRRRLRRLCADKPGGIKDVAAAAAVGWESLDQILKKVLLPTKSDGTRRAKAMGDDLARKIEAAHDLPEGWLDWPLDAVDYALYLGLSEVDKGAVQTRMMAAIEATHNHLQGKTLVLLENKFAQTVVSVTDKDIKAIKGTTLNAERASISKTTKKQQD